jgi:site-specific recombinase XerD
MVNHNPANERVKRRYFAFLKEAKRQSEATVDAVAKALARFETDTKHRDFGSFHFEQAVAFKKHLAQQVSQTTGEKLSKATMNSTLAQLKRFFQWLSSEPGYRSKVNYSDAEYFNLSEKDVRIANARRERCFPTLEQVKHAIGLMPAESELERRDQAVLAFTLLTGARDSAIASLRLRHVDLMVGAVYQDARDVKTKFSKSFTTYFFPVGGDIRHIVVDWVEYLRQQKLWGNEDPLFPATQVVVGPNGAFQASGLKRMAWASAQPIRDIFKRAFEAAGLPYCNPHSLRNTLVQLGEALCQTPEEFKAWSQNLGHDGVLTTFTSYGYVAGNRQAQIIAALAQPRIGTLGEVSQLAHEIARMINSTGAGSPVKGS